MSQLLKERICSSKSKFFPLGVGIWWKTSLFRETNRKSQKLLPILVVENSGVPIHHKSLMATALHYATDAFQWHTGH